MATNCPINIPVKILVHRGSLSIDQAIAKWLVEEKNQSVGQAARMMGYKDAAEAEKEGLFPSIRTNGDEERPP